MDGFYNACEQLLPRIKAPLLHLPESDARQVTEIRLRSGRPVTLSIGVQNRFVTGSGVITEICGSDVPVVSHKALQECFLSLCGHSVPLVERSLAQGFIPLANGHRAGVCGSAFYKADGSFCIRNITSVNIRVARTAFRCSHATVEKLLAAAQHGLLLVGAPASGKTTLLRALVEAFSLQGLRTAVVDERMELAPVAENGFIMPMPLYCDVLSGYPKSTGMQHALRTLSPQVLVCDEIGSEEDVKAVLLAVNSGVHMVASIHAQTMEELQNRRQGKALLQTGAFGFCAFLGGADAPGTVREIVQTGAVC